MEQAAELPLIIFRISSTTLIVLAFHNEFFSKKDIYLLPWFIGILTFAAVVCLLNGAFIQNMKYIHTGLIIIATTTGLSIISILRNR